MVNRAFKVIEALSNRVSRNTTVADISADTGISHSAVHRLLQALVEEGVVKHIPKRGYTLTPKLFTLGLGAVIHKGLLEFAIPEMRRIVAQSKETVSLNILSGNERVCIYRVDGEFPTVSLAKVGDKSPLFKGAVGKIFAAGLSQSELDLNLKIYVEKGFIKENEVSHIMSEVELVKEQGYSISIGELIPNSGSIAVPIKDIAGLTQASLSISALADRVVHQATRQRYLELLTDTVEQINYGFL